MSSGKPERVKTVSAGGAFGITHAGGREFNEDGIVALELPAECLLIAVADGLGGHAAGEVASSIALDVLVEFVKEGIPDQMDTNAVSLLLERAFGAADSAVRTAATGERAGMGTTLSAAIVQDGISVFANTGDSRAYIFSGGGSGVYIRFRTRDHSEVQEMVDRGLIDIETARTHPLRHLVTHSVGGKFAVDTYVTELRAGEVIVISSDGLHDYLSEDELISCIDDDRDSEYIAYRLFEKGMGVTGDNISVIVKVC